jgi:hypothetical protein
MDYLAGPYTHKSARTVNERRRTHCKAANFLLQKGQLIYSPIAHGHAIEAPEQPHVPYDVWIAHGLAMLALCEGVLILTLPGWRESNGVTLELKHARALGKRIYVCHPVTFGVLPFGE